MALYVDNIFIGGDDDLAVSQMKVALMARFECKDLGDLAYIVGIRIS